MTISQHANTFAGYPVVEWNLEDDIFANGTEIAVAIRTDWGENQKDNNAWITKFEALLQREPARQLPALVVGMWHYEKTVKHIVETLVANQARLPNLKALFVGDITYEEFEISWIKQGDLAPLWAAFPDLEHLTIRGGDGLKIDPLHLPKLKSLRIETGGLRREIVQSVGEAQLPELESLVLWLGTDEYGATTTIADLAPFYDCARLPKLKYLGLCDSDMADAVAEFIATAPVLQQLDVLDLSMGTLTDEGALALLTSPYIRHLKKLDLHHHYCSEAMVAKLDELAQSGIEVDTTEPQTERDWRFV
ncbi:MAG TPA: STM4015 family protein, partial [Phototrophicaceae bacterium]|nr:STM4015 family protein [Phototrophicaceae bacterium]